MLAIANEVKRLHRAMPFFGFFELYVPTGKIEGIEIGVSKRDTELVIRFFLQNKTAIEISELLGLPLDRVQQIITDYLGSK